MTHRTELPWNTATLLALFVRIGLLCIVHVAVFAQKYMLLLIRLLLHNLWHYGFSAGLDNRLHVVIPLAGNTVSPDFKKCPR